MSDDESVSVTVSKDTRELLRSVANRIFDDDDDVSYQQVIHTLASDRLNELRGEQEAIEEAQRRLSRQMFGSGDTPSDDEEALSDDERAAQKQRELAEELF